MSLWDKEDTKNSIESSRPVGMTTCKVTRLGYAAFRGNFMSNKNSEEINCWDFCPLAAWLGDKLSCDDEMQICGNCLV